MRHPLNEGSSSKQDYIDAMTGVELIQRISGELNEEGYWDNFGIHIEHVDEDHAWDTGYVSVSIQFEQLEGEWSVLTVDDNATAKALERVAAKALAACGLTLTECKWGDKAPRKQADSGVRHFSCPLNIRFTGAMPMEELAKQADAFAYWCDELVTAYAQGGKLLRGRGIYAYHEADVHAMLELPD